MEEVESSGLKISKGQQLNLLEANPIHNLELNPVATESKLGNSMLPDKYSP